MKKSKEGKLPKLPKTRMEAVELGVPEVYQFTEEAGPFFEVGTNKQIQNIFISALRALPFFMACKI